MSWFFSNIIYQFCLCSISAFFVRMEENLVFILNSINYAGNLVKLKFPKKISLCRQGNARKTSSLYHYHFYFAVIACNEPLLWLNWIRRISTTKNINISNYFHEHCLACFCVCKIFSISNINQLNSEAILQCMLTDSNQTMI